MRVVGATVVASIVALFPARAFAGEARDHRDGGESSSGGETRDHRGGGESSGSSSSGGGETRDHRGDYGSSSGGSSSGGGTTYYDGGGTSSGGGGGYSADDGGSGCGMGGCDDGTVPTWTWEIGGLARRFQGPAMQRNGTVAADDGTHAY